MASEIPPLKSVFDSSLTDESGQPNLIIDSSQSHKLIWTLTNNSQTDPFVLSSFGSSKVDEQHCHFKIYFNPGAFRTAPVVPGWNVASVPDDNGGIKYLYLAYADSKGLTLLPGGVHKTTFSYTRALQEQANTSKVTVHITTVNNVKLGNTSIPNRDMSPPDLNLIKEHVPTLSAPPIAVDLVGRRALLNDGLTSNDFTFAITNMLQADVELTTNTVFTVWFDAAPNEAAGGYAWAVARLQDLAAIKFGKPSNDWEIKPPISTNELKQELAGNPRWAISVLKSVTLKPQDPVLFTVKGLKTNLDPGIARMYLQFENVSNYPPGVLIGELEKTPFLYGPGQGNGAYLSAGIPQNLPAVKYDSALYVQQFGKGPAAVFNGGNVGIGTGANPPGAKLLILDTAQNTDGGSLIIGSGSPEDPSLRFGFQPKYAWIQSHAGKPLALNISPNNVGIGTATPGSSLSVVGGVAIGASVSQSKIGDNNLAVEGRIGINQTNPGSSLAVNGGVAIGKSYSEVNTTIGQDNLGVAGKVGINTSSPSARLQISDFAAKKEIFGNAASIGIIQQANESAALSLRKFDANAVLEFRVYDPTGAKEWSNYIQAEKDTADLVIGNAGKIRATGAGSFELGVGVKDKQVDAGKIGYKIFSDGLDIVGAGVKGEKGKGDPPRKVRVWDDLQTANLVLTGGAKITADNKQVLEFGSGVANKIPASGQIGYKVYSEGLDIVGATSNLNNRQIHLWDEVYCHGKFWRISNGFWCYLEPKDPVNQFSWDYAVFRYSSDLLLKTNVMRIPSAVDKVKRLRGCSYHWSDAALTHFTSHVDTLQPADPKLTPAEIASLKEAERQRLLDVLKQPQVGVIAQEVEQVLPEAVTTEEDGFKTVNYNQIIALLIEAVKEQQDQIDQLKQKLASV